MTGFRRVLFIKMTRTSTVRVICVNVLNRPIQLLCFLSCIFFGGLTGCSWMSATSQRAAAPIVWERPPVATVTTAPNLKVALIGDSGDDQGFAEVIQLIVAEEADLVLHQGDFSYAPGPTTAWLAAIEQLDPTIPYLGADGNHDRWRRYVSFFAKQVSKEGVELVHGTVASGSYAVIYQGLHLLFNREGGDWKFNQDVLRTDNHIWTICSWHHNRRDFQAGNKIDDVMLETYQACINGGAIIATGHEHSYSRSYTLADLSSPHHGAMGDPDLLQLARGAPGQGFFFVNGLGGRSLRDYHANAHDDDTWWATIYTSNRYCQQTCTADDFSAQDRSRDIENYTYTWGVLFIEFHVNDDPYQARGYFKTVDGTVIDTFTLIAQRE